MAEWGSNIAVNIKIHTERIYRVEFGSPKKKLTGKRKRMPCSYRCWRILATSDKAQLGDGLM